MVNDGAAAIRGGVLGGALVGIETNVESGELKAGKVLMVNTDQGYKVILDLGILLLRIAVDWKSEMCGTSNFGAEQDEEEVIDEVMMPQRGKMGDKVVIKDGDFNGVVLVETS